MVKKEQKIDSSANRQIKELEEKIAELTTGWQRTQADFLNYKKQAEEEKNRYLKRANADLIYELLPVLDNFQLAAKHIPEDLANNNWAQGVKQIEKQFEDILSGEGLERIATVGEEFDPSLHEAIDHEASDKPENEILEEVLSGYKFDGEVIRPARVKVSKGEDPEKS